MNTDLRMPRVNGMDVVNAIKAAKPSIQHALELHEGKRKYAAEHLGIPVRSLYNEIKRFGLE